MIPVRYIRDWLSGSNLSVNDNWVEIQALTATAVNVAAGCGVTASAAGSGNASIITDGSTLDSPRFAILGPAPASWVMVDLGSVRIDVITISVWHYYTDGRRHHGTKTEVSTDGISWLPLFDSATAGEYVETSAGHSLPVSASAVRFGFVSATGYFVPSCLPDRPQHQPAAIQNTIRTAGGVAYGFDPFATVDVFTLSWHAMLLSDVINLQSFFSMVNGMATDFNLIDSGASSLVSFSTPRIDITERVYGVRDVSLTLRLVI
jgi:hypothetical protein